MKKLTSVARPTLALFIYFCFLYSTPFLKSQTVQWAEQTGSRNSDVGSGIVQDPAGNLYTTGSFADTVAFGSVTLAARGQGDIFVTKVNPNNGATIWAKAFGGSAGDSGSGISCDLAGNIYITGSFLSSVPCIFDQDTLPATTQPPSLDIFVAKLDAATGNVLWVKNMGGDSYDRPFQIISDKASAVYVSGVYSSSVAFGNFTCTAIGQWDMFVMKLNAANGAVSWVLPMGTPDYDFGAGIAVAPAGDIYASGTFTGSMVMGDTTVNTTNLPRCFVTKIHASTGHVAWVKQFGSTGAIGGANLALNATGDLYASGFFSQISTFDSYNLSANTINFNDGYLLKMNPASGAVSWATTTGRSGQISLKDSTITMSATFYNTINVGSYTFAALGGNVNDLVVVTLNASNGAVTWAKQMGGTGAEDGVYHSTDGSGNIYLTGGFRNQTVLDTYTFNAVNGEASPYDIFLLKLSTPTSTSVVTGLTTLNKEVNDFHLLPNPSNGLLIVSTGQSGTIPYTLVITNVLGKTIFEISSSQATLALDLQRFDTGIYYVSITEGNGKRSTKKIIKE